MKKVKLKDVLTEIIDFSSKAKYSGRSNITSERYIPTLSALSVHNNFIDYSKCYYVTLNEYKEMTSNRIPKIGDILLTKEAPVGRVAMLDKDNIAIGRRLWLLTGKENILDNNYLLYFLQWNKTQKLLKSISGGSTVNINSFKNIEVNIHSYEEQIKIGHILSLIDKKINLNNKINDNLLKQAKHIYLHYFFNKKPNGFLNDLIKEFEKSKIFVKDAKGKKGKYPFYTSGDSILEFDRFLVDGRYCFLNTGGNADIKFYAGKASYSSDTWCIYSEHKMTDYLYLLLHTAKEEINTKYFEGTSLKHLQKELLKKKSYLYTNRNWNFKFQ